MISVITCTMRDSCLQNVFENYDRQHFKEKELIIVLTKEDMDISQWKRTAESYDCVRVFHKKDGASLGTCLNFAIQQANYDRIANFEDDDYYAPDYLHESNLVLDESGADVIGKTTVFLYMPERKMLTIFNRNNEHQFVNDQTRVGNRYLQGGTLFFKKAVLEQVPFRDEIRELDRHFCQDCMKVGLNVYSAGKEHFVYIRNDSGSEHTWKVPNDLILSVSEVVARTDDFIPYINRGINDRKDLH